MKVPKLSKAHNTNSHLRLYSQRTCPFLSQKPLDLLISMETNKANKYIFTNCSDSIKPYLLVLFGKLSVERKLNIRFSHIVIHKFYLHDPLSILISMGRKLKRRVSGIGRAPIHIVSVVQFLFS